MVIFSNGLEITPSLVIRWYFVFQVLGRTLRVDHVEQYKVPKEDPKHELDEVMFYIFIYSFVKATMAGPQKFYLHCYVSQSLNKLKQVACSILKVFIARN